jgi:phage recombination protein Bet
MTKALTTYSQSLTSWNPSQIALIKSQIAVNCTDPELALFGQVCQRTGLDPFSRQIYAIKRGSKMTIQVSIDGFRTIAARSNLYGGSHTEWCGDDGIWRDVWLGNGAPAAAKTTVHRIGSPHPFVAVAKYTSYQQQSNQLWRSMPDTMVAKVSESLALRKAFPAELSGLYTTEEFSPPEQVEDEKPTKIGFLKQAAKDCWVELEWDSKEIKKWAPTISSKSSSEWSLQDWERAVCNLHELIDEEDRSASGFTPGEDDGGIETDRQAYAKLVE